MQILPVIFSSVFTDSRYPLSGNTLATFWNFSSNMMLKNDQMQNLAKEINFSETTFLVSQSQIAPKVRIFTPETEIPFAGHPTLGTAFVLKKMNLIRKKAKKIKLNLDMGPIPIQYGEKSFVNMRQAQPQFLETFTDLYILSEILSIDKSEIATDFPPQYVSTGAPYLFVPIKSLKSLQKVRINKRQLKRHLTIPEIVVFTPETIHSSSDLHIRMFAPIVGINEDPATGSAAGPLTALVVKNDYLSRSNLEQQLVIEQGYEINRPSKIFTKIIGSPDNIKGVDVGGTVKIILDGKYYLD